MNTALYKTVHLLAVELLKAADADDEQRFDELYNRLQKICGDNEQDVNKNHPVQWETLADFTEDNVAALAIYRKALSYAESIGAIDYISSISYSCARILLDQEDREGSLLMALKAKKHADNGPDKELKKEINSLLAQLK